MLHQKGSEVLNHSNSGLDTSTGTIEQSTWYQILLYRQSAGCF